MTAFRDLSTLESSPSDSLLEPLCFTSSYIEAPLLPARRFDAAKCAHIIRDGMSHMASLYLSHGATVSYIIAFKADLRLLPYNFQLSS